jgi:hypothetical protein
MNEAALLMRASGNAAVNTTAPPAVPAASAAITTMPTSSKYVLYTNVPAMLTAGFPGNTFGHGSLLSPAPSVNPGTGSCPADPTRCDGVLGSVQMVVDAITFLQINK